MSRTRRGFLGFVAGALGWQSIDSRTRGSDSGSAAQVDAPDESGNVYHVPPSDGITGIQRIVDQHAPNVTITLGRGEYRGSALTVDHGVQLVGTGRNATVLKLADGANTDLITSRNPPDRNCMQARLENLTLDGNKANNASGSLVYGAFWNGRFVDCDFVNAEDKAFWLAGSAASTDDNYFRTCRFVGSNRDALQIGLNRRAGPAVGVTRVDSCWFGRNTGYAIRIRGSANIVTNSKFYANGGVDVEIDRGDYNQIIDNDISKYRPHNPCLTVQARKGVDSIANHVDGNIVRGSYRDGITCTTDGNRIEGLQVRGNTFHEKSDDETIRSAIYARDGEFETCSFTNNTILGEFEGDPIRVASSWETGDNLE
ncbi:right-handed parallel beta-helix repeat-containing protein [Haloarcula amylovorans]|uniref:right-handed parallel beta-helix repeat-containing protein n=1 Tax=Haloarcula amylovorans TaxID=2562280 RepID=UPI001076A7F8|nr:right-handed parallel beta-helix repeat-containing protein [Halomicroarcula amylolytica]